MSVIIPKDIDVLTIDLSDHDKQIRAEAFDECISIAKENSYEIDIDTPPYQETVVRLVDFMNEARKLKEQNK